MTANAIVYQDRPGRRVLDLRPHGVDCIPVLGLSDFHAIRTGPDYHVHPRDIEICLCVRGNLAFETAERSYPFLPGNIFVSTEREPHRMRHNPKGLLVYYILFRVPVSGRRTLGLSGRETEWLARSLLHLPKRLFKSTPRVKSAFMTLFDVYDHVRLSAARSVRLKTAAMDLLIGVIEAARRLPTKAPDAITAIMKAMREHPDRDYPLAEVAGKVRLSESSFSEQFKRAAGLPPHAYLLSCRIARAQKLLVTRNRTIASVADSLLFSSPQHFSSVFKRIVGTTPVAYVRNATERLGTQRNENATATGRGGSAAASRHRARGAGLTLRAQAVDRAEKRLTVPSSVKPRGFPRPDNLDGDG